MSPPTTRLGCDHLCTTPTSLQENRKLGQWEVVEWDQTAPGAGGGGRGGGFAAIHSRGDPGELPLHPSLSFPKRGVHIGSFSWTFRPPRSPWAPPWVERGQLATGRGGTGRRPTKGERWRGGGREQQSTLEGAWRAFEDQAPAGPVLAAQRGGRLGRSRPATRPWARPRKAQPRGQVPSNTPARVPSPATTAG